MCSALPMSRRPAVGIPVRGQCREGHWTEGTSEPGRVTAQVRCAEPGCGLRLTARRIPGVPGAGEPVGTATAPAGTDDPHRVRVVTEWSEHEPPTPKPDPEHP